jgi:hypothetical protein
MTRPTGRTTSPARFAMVHPADVLGGAREAGRRALFPLVRMR